MQTYRKTVAILTEEDIDIIAIHEAGHAIMSMNDGVIPMEHRPPAGEGWSGGRILPL
ncbi:MAG: hypothetical protein ACLRTA_06810 [Clostridia bacterium]